MALPAPVSVKGLVDTGASMTTIDPTIVTALSLPATGLISIITPSTGATPHNCPSYDVSAHIPLGESGKFWSRWTCVVAESSLLHQGFSVLIGRDLLSEAIFIYDGKHGTFSLAL